MLQHNVLTDSLPEGTSVRAESDIAVFRKLLKKNIFNVNIYIMQYYCSTQAYFMIYPRRFILFRVYFFLPYGIFMSLCFFPMDLVAWNNMIDWLIDWLTICWQNWLQWVQLTSAIQWLKWEGLGGGGSAPQLPFEPPAIVWAPLIESIKCYFMPK